MAQRVAEFKARADARQFQELFGKTSTLEPKLRNALRRKIRKAADYLAEDVRSEVMKEPGTRSPHPRSRRLRAGIRAGVGVQISANSKRYVGVFIRSNGKGLDAERKVLAARWNRKKGFRHPVFGNRENWAAQKGRQYFGVVIIENRKKVHTAVLDAMAEAEKALN
jgi:hypothetical protein